MTYLINGFPLLNIFLVFALLLGVKYIKPFPFILFFFVYATFHYAYTVPSLLVGDMTQLTHFHNVSNIYALLAEAVFLLLWVLLFVVNNRENVLDLSGRAGRVFIACTFLLIAAFALEHQFFSQLELGLLLVRNEITLIMTLFVAYLFSFRLRVRDVSWSRIELNVLISLSLIVLAVGIYEISLGHSWANSLMPDGSPLFRASSTLLNPNVLGLRGAGLVFFAVYLKDYEKASLSYCAVLFFVGAALVYITGSRSSMLFLIAMLMIYGGLKLCTGVTWRQSFKALGLYVVVFCGLCFTGLLHSSFSPLSERYLSLPKSFLKVCFGGQADVLLLTSIYGRVGVDVKKDTMMQDMMENRSAKAQAAAELTDALLWSPCVWKNGRLQFIEEDHGKFFCQEKEASWEGGEYYDTQMIARKAVPGKWFTDKQGYRYWEQDRRYGSQDYSFLLGETGWFVVKHMADEQWHTQSDVELLWEYGVWIEGEWTDLGWKPCVWKEDHFSIGMEYRGVGDFNCQQMYAWNESRWEKTGVLSRRWVKKEWINIAMVNGKEVNLDEGKDSLSPISLLAAGSSSSKVVYDNSYYTMKNDHFIVFVLWVCMLLSCAVAGGRFFLQQRNIEGVYALTSLSGFVMLGFMLQAYEVFPVWCMASLMLAQFFAWLDACYRDENYMLSVESQG